MLSRCMSFHRKLLVCCIVVGRWAGMPAYRRDVNTRMTDCDRKEDDGVAGFRLSARCGNENVCECVSV